MSDTSEVPIYSGRPMSITDLHNYETAISQIPSGAKIVTIEEARVGLKEASRCLVELQSISDISVSYTHLTLPTICSV